ncbi:uncharacterized protein FIBRA_03851 [Fibroporia radiculosa]|uniref:Methyltransferase domain-containing protein n=1 Tax=Fibroporia radiculosa TaxID=599839 RepID=J4H2M5_9APHY|nr:uncharacterized protein FIBRA_03851 [Fibroporia radiculosa]CCM01784.1 predicted protein [Fibroporia radiculosa]
MATYAKTSFNAARYAAARPTYPRQLYDLLFRYHERGPGARWDTALDLGCGTGQATLELVPFKNIIGADPSATMIAQATKKFAAQGADVQLGLADRVRYVQSPAEELGWLEDGSVDMIVSGEHRTPISRHSSNYTFVEPTTMPTYLWKSLPLTSSHQIAQAAHWFDWTRLWPEAARVLRKGGSLAVWGYSEFRLTDHPSCTPLIHTYVHGSDARTTIGPYWEQPGRNILDDHLRPIPEPSAVCGPGVWAESERVYFAGSHHPHLPNPRQVIMRKKTTWGGMLGYLRTFSALHTFLERYPEDKEHPEGDVAVRFWKALRTQVARDKGIDDASAGSEDDEVEIEWPLAIVMARRAAV